MDRRKAQKKRSKKTSLKFGLDESEALSAFETLAKALDIEVRYEKGDFKSGICRVNDKNLILIQKEIENEQKIYILARDLAVFKLDNLYVMPELRQIIDQVNAKSISDHANPEVKK
ncbi:hypothetical protein JW935_24495 [candidate division KSB1 bacterium]|nr:hypothetical protein [candidate division KSB1 bacterium]